MSNNIKFKGSKRKNKRPKEKALDPILQGRPSTSGIIIKIITLTPKKPNSAMRKVAKIRVKVPLKGQITEREINCYIPGEGHNLQANQRVYIRGGGPKDLIGVGYTIIRGRGDCVGIDKNPSGVYRTNGASKYGGSAKKNREAAEAQRSKK